MVKKILLFLFSAFFCLMITEGLLQLMRVFIRENKNSIQKIGENDFVILTLGESTTAAGGEDSWPSQLQVLLTQKFPDKKINIINKAIIGTNSTVLVGNLENQIKELHPHIIISMVGINDLYLSSNINTEFVPNLKELGNEETTFWDSLILPRLSRITIVQFKKTLFKIKNISFNTDAEEINEIGNTLRLNKNFPLAEEFLKRSISLEPKNTWFSITLSWLYQDMGRYKEAEELLIKSISIEPMNSDSYIELGNFYRARGEYESSEKQYQKALTINPQSSWALLEYGNWFTDQQQFEMAKEMFTKAAEFGKDPNSINALVALGNIERSLQHYSSARNYYKEAIKRQSDNKLALLELKALERLEQSKITEETPVDSGIEIDDFFHPKTQENYRRLLQIGQAHDISIIAVEYPLRNPLALETLIKDIQKKEKLSIEIKTVENFSTFRDAMKEKKYSDLFSDQFGGEFGHTTYEGGALLARNILNTLLETKKLQTYISHSTTPRASSFSSFSYNISLVKTDLWLNKKQSYDLKRFHSTFLMTKQFSMR